MVKKNEKAKTSKPGLLKIDKQTTKKKPLFEKEIKLEKVTKKPKKEKEHKKGTGGKILNVILSLFMILGITGMVGVLLFCAYIVTSAPPFETDKLYNKEATIIYDKNGNEFARIGSEQRELVSYDDLPQTLVDAIVATEDSKFFRHNGFDIVRFAKASLGQLAGQDGAGGASTLTMQVAKNTFSKDEEGKVESSGIKGIIRKFTDIYMAIFLIERNYTKEEIIEFYVNAPGFSNNTYGVEQACQYYFGKSVRDLSLTESALVAGIFNAPSIYNPLYQDGVYSDKRRSTVLNLMVRHGYITEEQAEDAKRIPVQSLVKEQTGEKLNKYQSFVDTVREEVIKKTNLDPTTTPMLIYTTMDPEQQDVMNSLSDGSIGYNWGKKDYIQIGLVVTDVHDGSISAILGRRNQTTPFNNNLATNEKWAQIGSTAKPIFAYGPFIEYNNGNTGTIFFDEKMNYSNGQEVVNADRTFKGPMTMRDALAQSRNIPAIQAFQQVDKDNIAKFASSLGIDWCIKKDDGTKDCNLYEAYAIGGGLTFSPVQMAGAYGAFARGGYYIEPYSVTKAVLQGSDEVIIDHKYEKVQVMSEETAYMITDMLVTATKQGVGGSIRVNGTEVASKTGTATYDSSALKKNKAPMSASASNWVITYSPDYVISFNYGVEELKPGEFTDSIPAAIERKKISALVANKIYKKNSTFKRPSGVVSAQYEKETNPPAIPSQFTPSGFISTELFKKGTEPSEESTRFSQLEDPTEGEFEVKTDGIELRWKGIQTPDAISSSYLQKYFNENYGEYAEKYLNLRYEYNNANIGTLGYQVFLNTGNGLQSLGYTTNTNYIYKTSTPGTYNFVIKSTYSIFKQNTSAGLNITATMKATQIPGTPEDDDTSEKDDDKDKDDKKDDPNKKPSTPVTPPKKD